MLLLVATSIGKAFLKYSVNILLKLFEVTYLLACKDIGSVNQSTKVYTIYIMLPQTSAAAIILDNSLQKYSENCMLAPKGTLVFVALAIISELYILAGNFLQLGVAHFLLLLQSLTARDHSSPLRGMCGAQENA